MNFALVRAKFIFITHARTSIYLDNHQLTFLEKTLKRHTAIPSFRGNQAKTRHKPSIQGRSTGLKSPQYIPIPAAMTNHT